MSAADDLARLITLRIPTWPIVESSAAYWKWADPHEDGDATVTLDGRERRWIPSTADQAGIHHGPTLVGRAQGVTVTVDLPELVDKTDMRSAMAALEAIDAIPVEAGK